jgi:hypothetical protein
VAAAESRGKAAAELEALRQEAAAAEQRLQAAKVRREQAGCPRIALLRFPALLQEQLKQPRTSLMSLPVCLSPIVLLLARRKTAGGLRLSCGITRRGRMPCSSRKKRSSRQPGTLSGEWRWVVCRWVSLRVDGRAGGGGSELSAQKCSVLYCIHLPSCSCCWPTLLLDLLNLVLLQGGAAVWAGGGGGSGSCR